MLLRMLCSLIFFSYASSPIVTANDFSGLTIGYICLHDLQGPYVYVLLFNIWIKLQYVSSEITELKVPQ